MPTGWIIQDHDQICSEKATTASFSGPVNNNCLGKLRYLWRKEQFAFFEVDLMRTKKHTVKFKFAGGQSIPSPNRHPRAIRFARRGSLNALLQRGIPVYCRGCFKGGRPVPNHSPMQPNRAEHFGTRLLPITRTLPHSLSLPPIASAIAVCPRPILLVITSAAPRSCRDGITCTGLPGRLVSFGNDIQMLSGDAHEGKMPRRCCATSRVRHRRGSNVESERRSIGHGVFPQHCSVRELCRGDLRCVSISGPQLDTRSFIDLVKRIRAFPVTECAYERVFCLLCNLVGDFRSWTSDSLIVDLLVIKAEIIRHHREH
jgi:hypothetical protein